jgi:hypothetical protein
VYVRDDQYNIQGQLDDYQSLELTQRWCDVGEFLLDIHRDNPQAANLTSPGWGIVVRRFGETIFSGPVLARTHVYDGKQFRVEVRGKDDNVRLSQRIVNPSPTENDPPYTTTSYDTINAAASSVLIHYVDINLGTGAVMKRQRPLFQVDADPGVGAVIKGRGRWQFLLPMLQELAVLGGTDIGFRVVQSESAGLPVLKFQVYRAIDRSATVKFGPALGNLAAFKYEAEAPECNYVYVGGQGEGTARTIVERQDPVSIATWGRLEGEFVDRRDTTDADELNQAGDEALDRGKEKAVMSIEPIDTPQQTYGRDYNLGDTVEIAWEEGTIRDAIREVKISLTPNGPQKITPSVGNVAPSDIYRFFRKFRALRTDLINLKRR